MNSLLLGSAAILAFACSSQKPAASPGPAQRAGATVDESAESAKDSAKRAGDKAGNATERAGEKLKQDSNK